MVLQTTPGFFIGPVFIYYYGIVYAITALALYLTLLSKRKKLRLNESQIDTFLISILIGMLIGGRIFHFLINDPSIFVLNPLKLFLIREGGMSFFGSAIGIVSGAWIWYKQQNKVVQNKTAHKQKSETVPQSVTWQTLLRMLDYGALVVSIALIFGRLANFLNQELVGRITDPKVITWCVEFATAAGCRHPYQLYAAASHVVLTMIVLFVLLRTKKVGVTFATFLTTYGLLRFVTDFWREDPLLAFGLTSWQFFAIGLAIVGAYLANRLHRSSNTNQKD